MVRRGSKTVKFDIEKDLMERVEKMFCYTVIEGEKIKVRHLSNVIREAVLRGFKVMIAEQKELRELYGTELIFLTEGGVLFADDLLREKKMREDGLLE